MQLDIHSFIKYRIDEKFCFRRTHCMTYKRLTLSWEFNVHPQTSLLGT